VVGMPRGGVKPLEPYYFNKTNILTTEEKIQPFDNHDVTALYYVIKNKLVFLYFEHNEI